MPILQWKSSFQLKVIVVENSPENYFTLRRNQSFLAMEWEHYLKYFLKYLIYSQNSQLSPLGFYKSFWRWGFEFLRIHFSGELQERLKSLRGSGEVIFWFVFVDRIDLFKQRGKWERKNQGSCSKGLARLGVGTVPTARAAAGAGERACLFCGAWSISWHFPGGPQHTPLLSFGLRRGIQRNSRRK